MSLDSFISRLLVPSSASRQRQIIIIMQECRRQRDALQECLLRLLRLHRLHRLHQKQFGVIIGDDLQAEKRERGKESKEISRGVARLVSLTHAVCIMAAAATKMATIGVLRLLSN